MTRFTKDVIDAPHTQREMASIPHQGNTLKGFKSALDDLGALYHGTPHHQVASLSAKDAEISQLAAALNKAKEENERLRDKLKWIGLSSECQWSQAAAKDALK